MKVKAEFPEEKACKKCGEVKSLADFHKAKGCRDGRHGSCKYCMRKAHKKWSDEHKEQLSEYYKLYGQEHRAHISESKKEYQKKNKEKIAIGKVVYAKKNKQTIAKYQKEYALINKESLVGYGKEYRRKNRDRRNRAGQEYYANNKAKFVASSRKRKATKKQRTPQWADVWRIQQYYILAAKLSERYEIQFHVDHVIPLQGKMVSGLHTHNNLQVITATENLAKNNKFVP